MQIALKVLLVTTVLLAGQAVGQISKENNDPDNGTAKRASATHRGAFVKIALPISIKSLPFDKAEDGSKDVLEVTNQSKKPISRLSVRILLLGKAGSIKSSFAARNDRWFGLDQKSELRRQKHFNIDLNKHHFTPDIVAVAGLPKELTWVDGTKWPEWKGPIPNQEGSKPVSIEMKGVVTQGDFSAPLLEFFNHSDKGIQKLEYQVYYFDKEGTELERGTRTRIGGIGPRQGLAYIGAPQVPTDVTKVRVDLKFATFEDGSKWKKEN